MTPKYGKAIWNALVPGQLQPLVMPQHAVKLLVGNLVRLKPIARDALQMILSVGVPLSLQIEALERTAKAAEGPSPVDRVNELVVRSRFADGAAEPLHD